MELLEYLNIIKKRKWIIIVITLIAVLLSGIMSVFVMKPVYEAKASFIIGRTPNSETDKVQYNDILMYQNLVKTYAELAKSRAVVEETITKSGYSMSPSALQSNLTITPKTGTQIIEIAIQDSDPERAANLTNTLSVVFVEKVKSYMNTEDLKIMDNALLPKGPIKPRVALNIIIAGFVGIMASLGIVFLLEYMDNTIKTEDDVEKYLGLTVLASIPFVNEKENLNVKNIKANNIQEPQITNI